MNTATKSRGIGNLTCGKTPHSKSQDSFTLIEILAGGVMILAGIIAVIVGILLKKKKKE